MSVKPITIIGGGLAGLTLGIGLRQQRIPVIIWEAGRYPRHRVCGEFISGRGYETLGRLGLGEKLIQAGAITANTAMFFSGNSRSPAHRLPKSALCLSRFVLDALLASTFRQLGGQLRENERWRDNYFGEGVVRANGRRVQSTVNGWHWFGLKIHARKLPLQADLEMHIIRNGYVGLTQLPNDEIDVCGLFRRSSNGRTDGFNGSAETLRPTVPFLALPRGWREALGNECSGNLGNRLSNASFDETSSCSIAGLSLRPQRATAQPDLCVGDALTMTPPVTGNGMSMAFESAELAIEPLVAYSEGKIDWAKAQRYLALSCDRAFARRLAGARLLQWMMFSPVLKGRLATLVLRSNWLWKTMFTNTR